MFKTLFMHIDNPVLKKDANATRSLMRSEMLAHFNIIYFSAQAQEI